jgi:5-methylcytosine-specific restriction endonuclease McrA
MNKQLIEEKVRLGYPSSWWYAGQTRDSANGWPQVYTESKYHCVYCRKDISTTVDEISASTTDHVVPQYLFAETGAHDQGPNHLKNLVTACAVCNSIKGGWAPDPSSPAWDSRKAFITEARKYINAERSERMKRYKKHIGEGARSVEIWDWTKPGEGDFA